MAEAFAIAKIDVKLKYFRAICLIYKTNETNLNWLLFLAYF